MIEIKNQQLFGKVIADALKAVNANRSINTWKKTRWINAIAKAVILIEEQPEFMEFHHKLNMLTIWNYATSKVYNANYRCECRAFELNQPCKHRCAKQLIKNYLEAEQSASAPVRIANPDTVPYLKQSPVRRLESLAGIRF